MSKVEVRLRDPGTVLKVGNKTLRGTETVTVDRNKDDNANKAIKNGLLEIVRTVDKPTDQTSNRGSMKT
jgi:hypothetical protein